MPKITRMSQDAKDMAQDIRAEYDGAYVLNQGQVARILGFKSRDKVREWLADLRPANRCGHRVWTVAAVAAKLVDGVAG